MSNQTQISVKKNSAFFLDELEEYGSMVGSLDTYAYIRNSINEAVSGADSLLDIGNGGVFDYDTSLVKRILAVDLFLQSMPADYACPKNVTLQNGDALALPISDRSHNVSLMVMLLHHLIADTVSGTRRNVEKAIGEAWRVVAPGGRLVVVESCIPDWFYAFEKIVFPVATAAITNLLKHPPTLQFPAKLIEETIAGVSGVKVQSLQIRRGKWVLQYGYRWPTALTPVVAWRFMAQRPG